MSQSLKSWCDKQADDQPEESNWKHVPIYRQSFIIVVQRQSLSNDLQKIFDNNDVKKRASFATRKKDIALERQTLTLVTVHQ